MDNRQSMLYREIFKKEAAARNRFILIQEQLQTYLSPTSEGYVVRTSRSSIPSNPNTIFNVGGNASDPILLIRESKPIE